MLPISAPMTVSRSTSPENTAESIRFDTNVRKSPTTKITLSMMGNDVAKLFEAFRNALAIPFLPSFCFLFLIFLLLLKSRYHYHFRNALRASMRVFSFGNLLMLHGAKRVPSNNGPLGRGFRQFKFVILSVGSITYLRMQFVRELILTPIKDSLPTKITLSGSFSGNNAMVMTFFISTSLPNSLSLSTKPTMMHPWGFNTRNASTKDLMISSTKQIIVTRPIRLVHAFWISPEPDLPVGVCTSLGRLVPPPGQSIFSKLSEAAVGPNRPQKTKLF